ncbi:YtxH domain-containing protein [uncultured Clostridium sp.]|uniref:YtxH domain-containing protein n=1 Tax=uncultured Clostridium sp. TaxID=59620 RepID=UPI0025FC154E|nr:YtxH domain-containing protein [uncultured Clostridium sp.]
MCKFFKGMVMGAIMGAAFEMMMFPQMDRRTQRNMRRMCDRMRHMAGRTYDGMYDWIR